MNGHPHGHLELWRRTILPAARGVEGDFGAVAVLRVQPAMQLLGSLAAVKAPTMIAADEMSSTSWQLWPPLPEADEISIIGIRPV
ncbi:hypothetical protein J2X98_002338 [Pseudarthrobacter enclensis]|uniref:MoeA C-terminal domain-containing protein n=1 Tax=Pseudarthrobacter enclensis TaxID=993070 RepID=A0ABT9RVC4_9MICC|nr:hypothetical protein [Pseudarthrobacter enclensis]